MTTYRSTPEPPEAQAATALQLLGDDTRRAIVEQLANGPLSVGQLAERLPVSRPAVSQHLGALKAANLVTDQAVGTRRIYRLDPAGLQLLRTYLDHMWARALEGFQDSIELTTEPTATTTNLEEATVMTDTTVTPVRREVTVSASPERAFQVFTTHFDAWWPRSHHIGGPDLQQACIEPREGGRWYEIGVDGSECEWGRVLAWEPPTRLVLAWQINGHWEYDPDPTRASEVEVSFRPGPDGSTVVGLEHRYLERMVFGEDAYEGIAGDGGWTRILTNFIAVVDPAF